MLLHLQAGIIYGPVRSRRLGRSLGINILPVHHKICSFNCLYCQYGLEESRTLIESESAAFPSPDRVLEAVEQALTNLNPPPAYITFSGNGEATLHPQFREIVLGLREIRNRLAPTAKTAILSNSTTVNNPVIREALALLDVRIMKLDAGTEAMFVHFNRPARGITLKDTVSGLAALEKVTIQSLFSKGVDGNYSPEHLAAWVDRIKTISPLFVQIYTLDRESPTVSFVPLEKSELWDIRSLLEKENIPAEVFGK